MSTGARVFAGVTIRGGIAAQRDSACLAGAQVHPLRAHFDALLAFALLRMFDSSIDSMCGQAAALMASILSFEAVPVPFAEIRAGAVALSSQSRSHSDEHNLGYSSID